MEDWIDLTNYRRHPTQYEYQVFHFKTAQHAAFFENLLVEHKIEFERHDERQPAGMVYYFALHQKDLKEAVRLNHLTIGKFRSRFIPDATFRWLIILFALISMTLALVGFFIS
ncbi:hypothetical protein KFE98_14510 [bacterium SCSIO 12741]|nr:hypothetical protein KFE98_14510 [bacterium SCSIO 12741]